MNLKVIVGCIIFFHLFKIAGFEILAFPCNQFGFQEPGSNTQIKQFACTRFKAEFPIFDKVWELQLKKQCIVFSISSYLPQLIGYAYNGRLMSMDHLQPLFISFSSRVLEDFWVI